MRCSNPLLTDIIDGYPLLPYQPTQEGGLVLNQSIERCACMPFLFQFIMHSLFCNASELNQVDRNTHD